ncbi:AAA family ATPase [Frankia sp. Cr2]|uniref:AAA family ATPase n=1 Tax=Frankia sp. Cr2 TaxID=3073932 RepID=UPI002AD3ECB6|nr:AAA family ATPase [Frankia sp. Cr2]
MRQREVSPAVRPVPFVRRARIRNYRSIADCEVTFEPLTVLLGLNAAGKSNILDALRFVADALTWGPARALAERGGIPAVLRRTADGWADSFSIELDLEVMVRARAVAADLDSVRAVPATYVLELRGGRDNRSAGQAGPVIVAHERCEIAGAVFVRPARFEVRDGQVVEGPGYLQGPATDAGSLLLPAAARWPPFTAVHAALRAMSFYVVSAAVMRRVEVHTGQPVLGRQGERLGEVLGHLATHFPPVKSRVDDYLAAIVPHALGVDDHPLDRHHIVQLCIEDHGAPGGVRRFDAESMSDGTLNVAGILAALFQPDTLTGDIPMVAVEDPEVGLHPTATGVLFDALTEASEHVQVIAATQSADLLDRKDFPVECARVVQMRDGITHAGPVDAGSREIISQGLATLGELLRSNQLTPRPDPTDGE